MFRAAGGVTRPARFTFGAPMSEHDSPVPPSAYLLADHLDATLAAGEDLLTAGRRCREILDGASDARALGKGEAVALRTSVELIRSLELALVTRVMKAREWSQMLVKLDPRFRSIGGLFIGGTAPLADAIAEFADATEQDFETGDGITAYFRSRGMLDADTTCLSDIDGMLVTERFLVTRRIELGPLLDLAAAYLDALEIHFTLFEAPAEEATGEKSDTSTDASPAGVTPAV